MATFTVYEDDTRPSIAVTMTEDDDSIIDMTPATRTAKFYYRQVDTKKTLWVRDMDKSGTPTDGVMTHTPNVADYNWLPTAIQGRGAVECEGEVRLEDTAATPPRDQRMIEKVLFTATPKFLEP